MAFFPPGTDPVGTGSYLFVFARGRGCGRRTSSNQVESWPRAVKAVHGARRQCGPKFQEMLTKDNRPPAFPPVTCGLARPTHCLPEPRHPLSVHVKCIWRGRRFPWPLKERARPSPTNPLHLNNPPPPLPKSNLSRSVLHLPPGDSTSKQMEQRGIRRP